MTQLSPNFAQQEFEMDDPLPEATIPIFTRLCVEILEPVRAQFGAQRVTSGYRDPLANAEAHGQSNSEHMASPHWCAADFEPLETAVTPRAIFDWMRENAVLPYHQLILEHSANGSSVIHVSINDQKPSVRSVLEGATHNAEPYVAVDHVAYSPAQPADLSTDGGELA